MLVLLILTLDQNLEKNKADPPAPELVTRTSAGPNSSRRKFPEKYLGSSVRFRYKVTKPPLCKWMKKNKIKKYAIVLEASA
ncbi:MAG: hypothetical protein ACRYFB_13405 [Janthinobacterium lividum]